MLTPFCKTFPERTYPAESQIREIDGRKVVTWERACVDACLLSVEVGTNGFHDGDSGHGSRTYIRLQDQGSTDLRCTTDGQGDQDHSDVIEIILGGDAELRTVKEALRWILMILETQSETFE